MNDSILIAIAFFGLGFMVATIGLVPILISIRRAVKRWSKATSSEVQPGPQVIAQQSEPSETIERPTVQQASQRTESSSVESDSNESVAPTASKPKARDNVAPTTARTATRQAPAGTNHSRARREPETHQHSGRGTSPFNTVMADDVQEKWQILEEAFEDESPIAGIVSEKVKGGFLVEVCGMYGFLPDSRADIRVARKLDKQDLEPLDFRVQQIDPQLSKIVLARDGIDDAELRAEREETMDALREGDVVEGYVKNLVEYGAFIDIGGVDGLLHLRNMSWRRIGDVSEVVTVGESINVKVLNYDEGTMQVSFGLKQLEPDPWEDVRNRIKPYQRILGTVTHITHYGCFVELEPGVEGLVHVSRMVWGQNNANPLEITDRGEQIEVMVLEINEANRHVDLSVRDCTPIPWDMFLQTTRVGDVMHGIVQNVSDGGISVLLSGNIIGTVAPEELEESEQLNYEEGDVVDVILLGTGSDNANDLEVDLRVRKHYVE